MKWLLIDASWLAYRVLYSQGKQWSIMDDPIGFIYGYLDQLRTLCHDECLQSSNVVFFSDSISSKRKESYPQYKENRHPIGNEALEELGMMKSMLSKLLTRILPKMGIPVYEQAGYEADDLIAASAFDITNRNGMSSVIITADQDLYQCLSPYVSWYNPTKRLFHTDLTFRAKYGVIPEMWDAVKSLSGCSSDNVAGIKGVGEKTALKYYRDELGKHTAAYKRIVSDEGAIIYERNIKLVSLPLKGTQIIQLAPKTHSMKGFISICEHYEFDGFLKGRRGREWRMILNHKMGNPLLQHTRKRSSS